MLSCLLLVYDHTIHDISNWIQLESSSQFVHSISSWNHKIYWRILMNAIQIGTLNKTSSVVIELQITNWRSWFHIDSIKFHSLKLTLGTYQIKNSKKQNLQIAKKNYNILQAFKQSTSSIILAIFRNVPVLRLSFIQIRSGMRKMWKHQEYLNIASARIENRNHSRVFEPKFRRIPILCMLLLYFRPRRHTHKCNGDEISFTMISRLRNIFFPSI